MSEDPSTTVGMTYMRNFHVWYFFRSKSRLKQWEHPCLKIPPCQLGWGIGNFKQLNIQIEKYNKILFKNSFIYVILSLVTYVLQKSFLVLYVFSCYINIKNKFLNAVNKVIKNIF